MNPPNTSQDPRNRERRPARAPALLLIAVLASWVGVGFAVWQVLHASESIRGTQSHIIDLQTQVDDYSSDLRRMSVDARVRLVALERTASDLRVALDSLEPETEQAELSQEMASLSARLDDIWDRFFALRTDVGLLDKAATNENLSQIVSRHGRLFGRMEDRALAIELSVIALDERVKRLEGLRR
jgi:hypothetical protein